MKTFVVAIAIEANRTPDWEAAEDAFAALEDPGIEPDAFESLWAATTPPYKGDVQSCVVGRSRLFVAAGTDRAEHSWAVDAIAVLVGTGVLEAAGFEVLIDG